MSFLSGDISYFAEAHDESCCLGCLGGKVEGGHFLKTPSTNMICSYYCCYDYCISQVVQDFLLQQ